MDSVSSSKLFSSNFLKMFTANIFLTSGFYMIMPLLPVYAVNELGIDKGRVGLVIGVFAISSVVARPIAGAVLDKVGRMVVYIPAAIMFALCFGLYIFSYTFVLILIARIIHGLSWGTVNTANSTIVSDIIPPNMRGQGMGYFGLSMNVAMALGPALGAFLIEYISFSQLFIICIGLSLTALTISSRVKPPAVKRDPKPVSIKTLFEKRVCGIAFIQFFFGLVYSGVMSYSVLHGMEIEAGAGITWFFLVFAIFISVFRPFAGKFMDKNGPNIILTAGIVFFGLGLVVLGVSTNAVTFLISAAVIGFGAGFVMPTVIAMTINVVSPSRRGAANATVFTAFDVGIGTGAILLGVIAKSVNYSGMYLASVMILAIPLLWFHLIEKGRYKKMYDETMQEKTF